MKADNTVWLEHAGAAKLNQYSYFPDGPNNTHLTEWKKKYIYDALIKFFPPTSP